MKLEYLHCLALFHPNTSLQRVFCELEFPIRLGKKGMTWNTGTRKTERNTPSPDKLQGTLQFLLRHWPQKQKNVRKNTIKP